LKFVIAALTMMALLIPAFGQTTAEEWFDKGVTLMNQSKYDEALKALDNAIQLDPQDADAWCNKGLALGILHKYDEAIQAFDKAIEINPQLVQAWYNKGNVLMNLRDYDRAIQAYDESHKLSPPGLPYTWYYNGIALDKLGKHEEAIQAYDKAIGMIPQMEGNPELIAAGTYINAKGLALQAVGRNTEAQAAFAKAKELGYTGPTFVSPDENNSSEAAFVPPRVPPLVPRKTVAERFAEANKIKKNATK
jgi:tetratricopeptide (TPR) repeat protein